MIFLIFRSHDLIKKLGLSFFVDLQGILDMKFLGQTQRLCRGGKSATANHLYTAF
jgi:hypothetical protein